MDEETGQVSIDQKGETRDEAYLVTLSSEWNTSEFLHMAIAIALFPKARQKVLMNRRLLFGKNQMQRTMRKLTK